MSGLMLTFRANPRRLKEVLGEEATQEPQGATRDGLGGRLGERLGETRGVIINAMLANPKVTTIQLARSLNISTTATEKHLRFLRSEGYVERVGSPRGGHWVFHADRLDEVLGKGVRLGKKLGKRHEATPAATPQVTPPVERLLTVLHGDMSRAGIQSVLNLKDRKSFRGLYLAPAVEAGLIAMTLPDKPNSRHQRYRLTAKGKAHLADRRSEAERP